MPFYQPIHQKKNSCRMFEAEKKYPASTYPKEKKVWKKFMHIPNHPPLPPPPLPPPKKKTTKGEMVGPLINF